MRTSAIASFVAVSALVFACGGNSNSDDSGNPNPKLLTTSGTFNALQLNPVDGVGVITTDPSLIGSPGVDNGIKSMFFAIISDRADLCGTGALRQNETVLAINAGSSSLTFEPGTYTEVSENVPGEGQVSIVKLDGTCGEDQGYDADSATVVITSVTPTSVSGTFNVTLSGRPPRDASGASSPAGTLQGSFNVPLCPSLASELSALASSESPTCVP